MTAESDQLVIWHDDGSVTLTPDGVQCLAEILAEWDVWSGWVHREDCQNWKRSAIARENRRESITLGNCVSSILGLFRHGPLLDLMKANRAERKAKHEP